MSTHSFSSRTLPPRPAHLQARPHEAGARTKRGGGRAPGEYDIGGKALIDDLLVIDKKSSRWRETSLQRPSAAALEYAT